MNFREKLERPGPKKLLACDGGGVRGIVSIEILARIEVELRKLTDNPQLVLADYFDYVAGSSVGAIIATLVALGLSVDQIRQFFAASASEMFQKARPWERLRTKFRDAHLSAALRAIIGEDTTIGSDLPQTLLMIVLRNATTNSPGHFPIIPLQYSIIAAFPAAISTCRFGSWSEQAPPLPLIFRPRSSPLVNRRSFSSMAV